MCRRPTPRSTRPRARPAETPDDIVRAANVMALDEDRPDGWADQLAQIAEGLRFSTLLVGVPGDDPLAFVRRLGEDVAPRLRELLG